MKDDTVCHSCGYRNVPVHFVPCLGCKEGNLAYRTEFGGIKGMDWKDVQMELYGALTKLKRYEDTGLDPDKIKEIDELYLAKCEEVNELKKQIEIFQKAAGLPVQSEEGFTPYCPYCGKKIKVVE